MTVADAATLFVSPVQQLGAQRLRVSVDDDGGVRSPGAFVVERQHIQFEPHAGRFPNFLHEVFRCYFKVRQRARPPYSRPRRGFPEAPCALS